MLASFNALPQWAKLVFWLEAAAVAAFYIGQGLGWY